MSTKVKFSSLKCISGKDLSEQKAGWKTMKFKLLHLNPRVYGYKESWRDPTQKKAQEC
ncbi:unnamed protein product [Ixodes pacificus]